MVIVANNDFYMDVSRGRIYGHSTFHGYGTHPTITTALTTVWEPGGLYVWPTTALVMSIVSSSANDAAAGIGGRTLVIAGLDIDRKVISEVIIMNGVTPVLTTKAFYRINAVTFLSAGTSLSNEGNITISNAGTTYSYVLATEGRSQMGVFALPGTVTGYVSGINYSVSSGKTVEFQSWVRPPGGAFFKAGATQLYQSAAQVALVPPTKVPRGSDIEFRAIASAAATVGTVGFDIILVEE